MSLEFGSCGHQGKEFFLSNMSAPPVERIQSCIQWLFRALYLGGEGATACPDFSKFWELNALGVKRVFSVEVASDHPQK
jgi:hypothetical protein